MIQYIDWVIAFGYFFIFFVFVWFYAFFKFEDSVAKTFIKLFVIRVFGGILFALIFVYYYGSVGDSVAYWEGGYTLSDLFYSNPSVYFSVLYSEAGNIPPELTKYVSNILYANTAEEWFMTKIVSLIGLIGFKSYLVYNMFFGVIGFVGSWQILRFVHEFIEEIKIEAYYVLAIVPGILIWSSGLIKDTITFACFSVFLLYYCRVVFKNQQKIKYYIILVISAYLMFRIKPYVLICEIPALAFATYIFYKVRITIPFLRRILMPSLLIGLMFGSIVGVVQIAEASEKYRLETLETKVKGFQSWHETLGGSYYSIAGGNIEYTVSGVLKTMPEALSHTFFRPFLWEARNASMLLTAVESSLIIILFIISLRYYIMDYDLRKFLHRNHIVVFLFIFSVVFGFTVGFTAYNYGALGRYKVPAQICFLFLLFYIVKKGREFKHI